MSMRRALALLVFLVLPSTATAASKVELDARVQATLEALKEVQAGRDLAQKAVGMLVFPSTVKGGIGLGAEYGEGALLVGGQTVEYYRVTAVSFGFQLGGQARSQVVMFMTEAALDHFRNSDGWEAGVDGSIALIEFGVGKQVDTNTLKDPIIGFMFNNKGLMYDLSFVGSKFWKTKKS